MPSTFWKLADGENHTPQYAVPFTSSNAVKETQTTTTAIHLPKVPAVRTTLPSEDSNEERNAISRHSKSSNPGVDVSAITEPKQSRQKDDDFFASALKARKFHLIKHSPRFSPFLAPKTFAQKHRKNRQKDLAVFIERIEIVRKAKRSSDVSRPSMGEPGHIDNGNSMVVPELEKPHKRPNATAAERKWRTETWANPSKPNEINGNPTRTAENIDEPSSQWNYESTQLAEQLQEVALEELRASEERVRGFSDVRGLKVKPKPPKPRQPRIGNLADDDRGDDIMTDTTDLDDDCDYVLDTYIRSNAQPFGDTEPAKPYGGSLLGVNHGNIGILVIEDEEEEALWEAFAENQESDPEWNSEEEDENGLQTNSPTKTFTNAINSGRLLWK